MRKGTAGYHSICELSGRHPDVVVIGVSLLVGPQGQSKTQRKKQQIRLLRAKEDCMHIDLRIHRAHLLPTTFVLLPASLYRLAGGLKGCFPTPTRLLQILMLW